MIKISLGNTFKIWSKIPNYHIVNYHKSYLAQTLEVYNLIFFAQL